MSHPETQQRNDFYTWVGTEIEKSFGKVLSWLHILN